MRRPRLPVAALRDLNQPADLFWAEVTPPMVSTPCTRKFEALRQAIRYVMEDLPPRSRESAFIVLPNGTLPYPAISAEYRAQGPEFWRNAH